MVAVLWLWLEWWRIRDESVHRWFTRLAPVYRESERHRVSGAGWLVLGVATAAWFPAPAATAGILVGTLADPAAAVVGGRFGRANARGKSIAGSSAAFVVSGVVVFLVVGSLWVALLGAAVATAVERWPVGLDDNVLVAPAVAALLVGVRGLA